MNTSTDAIEILDLYDRAIAIKRRKQIWEALHPAEQVGQIVPPEIGYKKPPPQRRARQSARDRKRGWL
jgi:hypothetical protein